MTGSLVEKNCRKIALSMRQDGRRVGGTIGMEQLEGYIHFICGSDPRTEKKYAQALVKGGWLKWTGEKYLVMSLAAENSNIL